MTERHIGIFLSLVSLFLLLGSCVNDLESIEKVTYDPKSPDETTRDLHVFYTDSGYAKVELYATIAETYNSPERITKFKDGIRVLFYSADGKIVSRLTALYGQINYQNGTILVRDSVQLVNLKKQQRLETENLNWNRKDSSVFTNSSVVVRSRKGALYGDGIRTKQDFSSYEFIRPRGEIDID